MKVAVITPYHKVPTDWLVQCLESVRSQTYTSTHILVADGIPQDVVDTYGVQHLVLPRCHGDYGDTPRAIGSISAIGQGFDAIAWLDADNWFASYKAIGVMYPTTDIYCQCCLASGMGKRKVSVNKDARHTVCMPKPQLIRSMPQEEYDELMSGAAEEVS